MKVVLVTYHAVDGERRTGFHFWADLLDKQGVKVDWLTAGFSDLTAFKKDARSYKPPHNTWANLTPNLRKYVWKPLFHPANFDNDVVNMLAWPVFSLYPMMMPADLKDGIKDADLFIVESGAGATLVPELAKICPNAKFLYNFSDRYSIIKYHPMVPHSEKKALKHYDMIRVNAAVVANDFPKDAPVVYVPQAIDKDLFDAATINPYKKPRNAISVGDMQFDANVIETLAEQYPDWHFHLFGRKSRITKELPNVTAHGEFALGDLVPYIKFADIGIAPYSHSDDGDYLSQSSLKLVQYTYCKLPIVAPHFASLERNHVLAYDAKNVKGTVGAAFQKAIGYDRDTIDTSSVLDWQEMLARMMAVMEKKRA